MGGTSAPPTATEPTISGYGHGRGMIGRLRIALVASLAAVALGGFAAPAGAQLGLAVPNPDWTTLLPPIGTPSEAQPGPVEYCEEPSVACMDSVVDRLEALRDDLGCDHRGVFATTYLELSRELRRAFDEDPPFFQDSAYLQTQAVTFVDAYFDAFEAGRTGARSRPAWRIAFETAESGQITGAQEMLLGINAHVQNDMAFVIAQLGVRFPDGSSRKPDHDRVNETLNRAYDDVVREVGARYDSTMALTNPKDVIVDDVGGLELARTWRELVWRNAERLVNARTEAQRTRIGRQIQMNAAGWARGIAAVQVPGIRKSRDAYCASQG